MKYVLCLVVCMLQFYLIKSSIQLWSKERNFFYLSTTISRVYFEWQVEYEMYWPGGRKCTGYIERESDMQIEAIPRHDLDFVYTKLNSNKYSPSNTARHVMWNICKVMPELVVVLYYKVFKQGCLNRPGANTRSPPSGVHSGRYLFFRKREFPQPFLAIKRINLKMGRVQRLVRNLTGGPDTHAWLNGKCQLWRYCRSKRYTLLFSLL